MASTFGPAPRQHNSSKVTFMELSEYDFHAAAMPFMLLREQCQSDEGLFSISPWTHSL